MLTSPLCCINLAENINNKLRRQSTSAIWIRHTLKITDMTLLNKIYLLCKINHFESVTLQTLVYEQHLSAYNKNHPKTPENVWNKLQKTVPPRFLSVIRKFKGQKAFEEIIRAPSLRLANLCFSWWSTSGPKAKLFAKRTPAFVIFSWYSADRKSPRSNWEQNNEKCERSTCISLCAQRDQKPQRNRLFWVWIEVLKQLKTLIKI